MDKKSRQRLLIVTVVLLIIVVVLVFRASRDSYSYYKSVNQVVSDKSLVGVPVRVSGRVVTGSLSQEPGGYRFEIADAKADMRVDYNGVLPQTFNDGVQVVAEGVYKKDNRLVADKILTKCPTKYKTTKPSKSESSN